MGCFSANGRGIIYLFNYGSVSTCGSSILYICLVGPAGDGRSLRPAPVLSRSETVPLAEDVDVHMAREVLPHVPEAWVDEGKTKIGYEIPLNRLFYVYEPPRPLDEIEADLQALEREIASLLSEVTA